MSNPRFIDGAQAEQIFTQRELFRLRLHLFANRFRRFHAYYSHDTPDGPAVCILPAALLIRDAEEYRVRDLRLAGTDHTECFALLDGEPGVALAIEGEAPEFFKATNLERLLRAGEERIFINDREGRLTDADFAEFERNAGLASGAALRFLIDERYAASDGTTTARRRRAIEMELFESETVLEKLLPQLPPDESGALEKHAKVLRDVIEARLRSRNPVAERYSRPLGLFNFDRGGVNYTAHLGRGEHNVFFEYLIGNRYGNFMPYSFTDAAGNPELSIEIYRELVEREILDARGRLSDIRRLDHLDCLPAGAETEKILANVREVLRSARLLGVEDIRNDLKYDRGRIETELAETGLSFETIRGIVNHSGHPDHHRFLAAYQESKIHQEINAEAVKNRGIVLGDPERPASILLLITDGVQVSAPYYTYLLDAFTGRFAARGNSQQPVDVRIAHAYTAPSPRNPRVFSHPVLHALQMMERETSPELNPGPESETSS